MVNDLDNGSELSLAGSALEEDDTADLDEPLEGRSGGGTLDGDFVRLLSCHSFVCD